MVLYTLPPLFFCLFFLLRLHMVDPMYISSKMEKQIKSHTIQYTKQPRLYDIHEVPWSPSGLRRFPWSGVVPLVLSICCTGVAIGIVLGSNGGLEKNWSGLTQPGVLLAYTSTVANLMMGLAFAQATVIFFWVQATAPIPISNLHYNWAGSSGILGALKSISHGKAIRISLVTILVTITSLLRGPLMQRASSVQVTEASHNGFITLPVNYNISSFWGGTLNAVDDVIVGQFSPGLSDVTRDFLDKTPIRIPGAQCDNCTLTIKAFGFDVVDCTETRAEAYDFGFHYLPEKINTDEQLEKKLMFESWVSLPNFGESGMMLEVTTRRKDSSGCTGNILNHTCYLDPSAMLYDISLQSEIATLQSKSWRGDSFVGPVEDEEFASGTTWLPLWQIGRLLFASSSWVQYENGFYRHLYNEGLIANLYAANWSSTDPNDGCSQYFNDPMDYIINSYRDIAFRMSVRSAADPIYDSMGKRLPQPVQTRIPYTRHFTQVQYASHIPALVLATIVSLAGPLATLVLFWGWWRLGRDFTMSPLELANAILQPEQPRSEQAGRGGVAEQNKTTTEETLRAVEDRSGGDGHPYYRHQGGQQLSSVFASCSGNPSADRLAEHFRRLGRTGNADSVENEGEPRVQYGVVQSDAGDHLGFAVVSGPQGAAVRQPRKGGLL